MMDKSDYEVLKFISIFEELSKNEQKCNQLIQLSKETSNLIDKNEINDFIKQLNLFVKNYSNQLNDEDVGTTFTNPPLQSFDSLEMKCINVGDEEVEEKRQHFNQRIYADGVFDLTHSGHFNALRQAKALGNQLVVGINSDSEVIAAKGLKPIYSEDERAEIIAACKWVDEVVVGTPYDVSIELLDKVNCHYAAHGDDVVVGASGTDCYAEPRKQNRLKVFKRTQGVSSTTLLRRLLIATDEWVSPMHHTSSSQTSHDESSYCQKLVDNPMVTSSKRLHQFIGVRQPCKSTDRRIYVDGSFDIFHVGHVRVLQKAKELGDYLIVGVHDDHTIGRVKGRGFPVVNLLERVLNVLAMRAVDEVIIGAPWNISHSFIKSHRLDLVVRGSIADGMKADRHNTTLEDPYKIPKQLQMYHEIPSTYPLTASLITKKIIENRLMLQSSLQTRIAKENSYWLETEKECISVPLEI